MQSFRKPIIVSEAGIASVTLAHETGMKSDFGDVRFLDLDGVTELDYKRDSYTNGVTATFLVDAPAGQIYAYFGDPALSYVSIWEPTSDVIREFTHEAGYVKDAGNPVIAPGASGSWNDWMIYSVAPIEDSGTIYAFYGGGQNVGTEPRHETEIGLATSTDGGDTWTDQGKQLDKDDFPGAGVAPFCIVKIGALYYLFVVCFDVGSEWGNVGYVTSTDLASWSSYTKCTGLVNYPQGPFVMEDPDDADYLLMYYTRITDFTIRRARAAKSDPSSWIDQGQVLGSQSLYPDVRKVGDIWEMFYAKYNGSGYDLIKTVSRDGLHFQHSGSVVIPNGGSGAWDENYICTPRRLGDLLFYSARRAGVNYYEGIGLATLTAGVGSLIEWGYKAGSVGVTELDTLSYSGDWCGVMTGSATTNPVIGFPADGNNKIYEVWIYDPASGPSGQQITFRPLTSAGFPQVLVGFDNGKSASKYVYRLTGGSWAISNVSRSQGWHRLSYDVTDSEVLIKIDDTLVATDSAFDVDDLLEMRLYGYTAGSSYFDNYRVLGTEFVSAQVGTELLT